MEIEMKEKKITMGTKKVMEAQKKSEETGEIGTLKKYKTAIWITIPVQFAEGEAIKHLQHQVHIHKDQYLTLDIYAERAKKDKPKSGIVKSEALWEDRNN